MSLGGQYRFWLNQPQEVSIETLALCNARCTFCPYPTLERQGVRMSDELLARLVDEMATFRVPFYFSPFKVNEPLLDKRLIPLCRTMNERQPLAKLRIFSNGTGLTDANIASLSELSNLEQWVSLNSVDPVEYETLMGLKFERTAARLDALHAARFPHPVTISRVGIQPEFSDYVRKRWPRFKPFELTKHGWLGYTDDDIPAVPDTPCRRWWELSVMATGVVSLCCMDGTGEFAIGDVNKNTLLEVYNAPHWRERRLRLLSRKGIHPCSTCSY